jgi:Ca2+-binding EF-hand superfamily protein
MQLGTRHVRQATSLARPAMASVQYGVQRQRHYRIENRIEDMLSASEAWQAASGLESGEISDVTLRAAFKRIDTNGNGVIEKHELQAALLASGQIEEDAHIKQTVDNMIEWACTKAPNGDIDFEEYARIMRVKLDLAKQGEAYGPGFFKEPSSAATTQKVSQWATGGGTIMYKPVPDVIPMGPPPQST